MLSPTGTRLLVRPLPEEQWPEGTLPETPAIHLPDSVRKQTPDWDFGTIVRTGPEVSRVEKDQIVFFQYHDNRPSITGLSIVEEGEIAGVYEP